MSIVVDRETYGAAGSDWWHGAACVEEDPELFFPVGTSGPALLQVAEAKFVCSGCGVRATCLEWALAEGQDHGIWGGLDEEERRALRRRRAGAARRDRGAAA